MISNWKKHVSCWYLCCSLFITSKYLYFILYHKIHILFWKWWQICPFMSALYCPALGACCFGGHPARKAAQNVGLGGALGGYQGDLTSRPLSSILPLRRTCAVRRWGIPCRWDGGAWRRPNVAALACAVGAAPRIPVPGSNRKALQLMSSTYQLSAIIAPADGNSFYFKNQPHSFPAQTPCLSDAGICGWLKL